MMIGSKKFQVILILLMAASLVEGRNNLDYFRLDLVWPNSYCNLRINRCREPVPQDFRVHSLWPRKANHHRTAQPSGLYFNKEEVEKWNFSRTLSSIWPNLLVGQKDIYFWQWAWNKDGRFSGMTAENYFYLALVYAKKYKNLYHSLLESGVIITSDQLYGREILYGEISNILGTKPIIRCNSYKVVKQLAGVIICIDIMGIAFDCVEKFSYCGDREETILFATEEMVYLSRGHQDMVESLETSRRSEFNVNHSGVKYASQMIPPSNDSIGLSISNTTTI